MKLLLVNPELPLSLMSFSHSCDNMGAESFTPPLGLITVAALLPDTWEVRVLDLNCSEISEGDWEWAEAVLLSGMLLQGPGLLSLVREGKERGKFVVCGGPYVSSVPEPALEAGTDVLVCGEAETVRDSIIEAITSRNRGVVIESPKPDITSSPTPRFDLLSLSNYMTMAIQTSRGCPFECEFCDVVHLYGRKMRYKTPEQISGELQALYDLGWSGLIFVSDDNFIGSRTNARSILQEMVKWSKSHGEPFGFATQASLNLAQDPELIDLMTEANFSYVLVGVESPDKSVLEHNRKMQNIENPVVESLRMINSRGLTVIASFVIGFDGEERGVDERISDVLDEAGTGLAFVNLLQAMPNTRLWNRLESEGRLLPQITSGETLASRMNFVPSRPVAEIKGEWANSWNRLYEPDRCFGRIVKGFLEMRPTRAAMGIESEAPVCTNRFTFREKLNKVLKDLKIFSKLIRLLGLRYPTAAPFWKNALIIRKKNPSRLVQYFMSCSFASNLFLLRDEIRVRSQTGASE